MDLSNLSPAPGAVKKRKRIGRGPGSGHGKTSGRGHKGQKSRSGYSRRFGFEGGQMPLNRRLPKRGFNHSERHPLTEINVDVLAESFEDGAEITLESLLAKHVIKKTSARVKVLGRGEVTKKLVLKVDAISESARSKVEAAGGSVELIEAPVARAVKNRKKGQGK
ncbi:MAG TPA: 50S ribosomal protein L15 [Candidatus Hydrogenedentes bacterium]|nr:50S ribosomal protein L15 [Candidatus Hydrogenedentota bacterium]